MPISNHSQLLRNLLLANPDIFNEGNVFHGLGIFNPFGDDWELKDTGKRLQLAVAQKDGHKVELWLEYCKGFRSYLNLTIRVNQVFQSHIFSRTDVAIRPQKVPPHFLATEPWLMIFQTPSWISIPVEVRRQCVEELHQKLFRTTENQMVPTMSFCEGTLKIMLKDRKAFNAQQYRGCQSLVSDFTMSGAVAEEELPVTESASALLTTPLLLDSAAMSAPVVDGIQPQTVTMLSKDGDQNFNIPTSSEADPTTERSDNHVQADIVFSSLPGNISVLVGFGEPMHSPPADTGPLQISQPVSSALSSGCPNTHAFVGGEEGDDTLGANAHRHGFDVWLGPNPKLTLHTNGWVHFMLGSQKTDSCQVHSKRTHWQHCQALPTLINLDRHIICTWI
jgi:hypothetical protein